MRKGTLLVAAIGFAAAATLTGNAGIKTLAALEAGDTFTSGPLTFSDFKLVPQNPPTVGAVDPNFVFVEDMYLGKDAGGHPIWGFGMNGGFDSGLGGSIDYKLTYKVTGDSAKIHDIYGLFVPTITLGGPGSSSIQIGELVLDMDLNPIGQLNVGYSGVEDAAGNQTYGDPAHVTGEVILGAPIQSVWVKKDILLTSVGQFNAASATIIDQGFSVPEPGMYVGMFALGLMGFAMARKYRV